MPASPVAHRFIRRIQEWRVQLRALLAGANQGERRLRRVGLTGLVTLVARGITLVVSLLSLPLASSYLGRERFGLWLLLVGVINLVGLTDLGLANSLLTALAQTADQPERVHARRLVSSAFWLSLAVAGALLLIFGLLLPLFDWAELLRVSSPLARQEIALAVMIVLVCFVLRMLATISFSVYTALQDGFIYQLFSALSGVLSGLGLWAAVRWQGSLAWLIGGYVGGWLIGETLAAMYLFGWRHADLRPRWLSFDCMTARTLLRNGGLLWIAQISAVLLLQTDLFVVTRLFGADEVAAYGTAQRLFGYVGIAHAAFAGPLWAAYSEAHARGDAVWLRRTFGQSLWLTGLLVVPGAIFVEVFAPWLFGWLVPADVMAAAPLLLALCVTECLNGFARCIAMLLNGLGALRLQALFGPLAALANLVLSVVLGKWLGAPGVAWATALCLLLFWLGLLGNEARLRLRISSSVAQGGEQH